MLLIANEMTTGRSTDRCRGAAGRFVDTRLAEGRVAFTLAELIAETGLSAVAANNQLRRLRARVCRVSRPQPFFLIVDAGHRLMGAPPVDWWLDEYFRWLGHPYYVALLSAAALHGVAPQAVQVHQVMTDTPRRGISVGRLRVRFFSKRDIERTPVQQQPGAYAPLRVSTPETTCLDLVGYASRMGGMARANETLASLVPLMRTATLRDALDAERNVRSAQRLGYLLDRAGADRLAAVVQDWLPARLSWCPLGTRGACPAHRSLRWRVLVHAESLT